MIGRIIQQQKRIKQSFRKKAIVLCYHRVAEVGMDPWELIVSPSNFEAQIRVLANHFNVVSVPDLLNNFGEVADRKTVCVTFDDGYRDNFFMARPILRKYAIPSTFFISSGFINSDRLFWWDELADLILMGQRLPPSLSLQVGSERHSFSFDRSLELSDQERIENSQWRSPQPPPNNRCRVFLKLWNLLRPLEVSEQKRLIQEIKESLSAITEKADPDRFPMPESELVEIGNDAFFTIGLHTENHAALGLHPFPFQEKEVLQNQRHLQDIIGKKPDIISFPYGSYNQDSLQVAEKLALNGCFNSKKSLIFQKTNQYQLGRYPVKNWDGEEFKAKLNKWFLKV